MEPIAAENSEEFDIGDEFDDEPPQCIPPAKKPLPFITSSSPSPTDASNVQPKVFALFWIHFLSRSQ